MAGDDRELSGDLIALGDVIGEMIEDEEVGNGGAEVDSGGFGDGAIGAVVRAMRM